MRWVTTPDRCGGGAPPRSERAVEQTGGALTGPLPVCVCERLCFLTTVLTVTLELLNFLKENNLCGFLWLGNE